MTNFSILKIGFLGVLALGLASCSGARFNVSEPTTGLLTDDVPNQLIQDGNIRVGVVLPLGTKYGKIVKNALELAVIDNKGAKILMFIENSSTLGARSAARKVIAKGAEIIIGPITSTAVRNVGVEARAAGIPVIAFSQDVKVAGNGVYLQSFLREKEIQKVVAFAASRGLKRFASLTPKSGFGQVVAASFRQAAGQYGSLVATGTYTPLKSAASKTLFINDIKNFAAQATSAKADVILLPEGPSKNNNIIKVMESVGFKTSGVKFLGTSLWNKSDTNAIPQLAGSWFANADASKLNRFNSRYASLFGSTPSTERAALAYDALSLVATLGRTGAAGKRFSPEAIARAGGFGGVLGHYSYNFGGVSNYSLNIMQVSGSGFKTVSSGSVAGN